MAWHRARRTSTTASRRRWPMSCDFYDTRFHLGLTSQDVADLSAFLAAL